jgi:hypothetical protein|eukprot:COSAG01_NODE_3352_length_6220_cov_190.143219_2_plen_204_part_00
MNQAHGRKCLKCNLGWVYAKSDSGWNTYMVPENDELGTSDEYAGYYRVNRPTSVGAHVATRDCYVAEGEQRPELERHDLVEVVAHQRDNDDVRLNVVRETSRGGIPLGWISVEKEHKIDDNVREMLHKSKLGMAEAWGVSYANSEELRKLEIIFAEIATFKDKFEDKLETNQRFEQHFPDRYRPAMCDVSLLSNNHSSAFGID